jgi:hypothetical protein
LPRNSIVGGIGMFIKNSLTSTRRCDLELESNNKNKVESLWYEINKDSVKYITGGIYKHPDSSIDIFTESLEKTLSKINKKNNYCFIAGDFNIDLLKFENNPHIDSHLNTIISSNFFPSILSPTRITSSSTTLIDNIMSITATKTITGFTQVIYCTKYQIIHQIMYFLKRCLRE